MKKSILRTSTGQLLEFVELLKCLLFRWRKSSRIKLIQRKDFKKNIVANNIESEGENLYFCMDAPEKEIVDDFWQLMVQEKADAILMLCDVVENGVVKSEEYWAKAFGQVC